MLLWIHLYSQGLLGRAGRSFSYTGERYRACAVHSVKGVSTLGSGGAVYSTNTCHKSGSMFK